MGLFDLLFSFSDELEKLAEYTFSKGPNENDLEREDIHHNGKNVAFLVHKKNLDHTWIDTVYVVPKHRGHGLASSLLSNLTNSTNGELRLRARPIRDKTISTERLKKLYRHYGFEDHGDNLMVRPGKEKLAVIQTELQPHQQRVVDKIKKPDQPGLVVAHGLGSGKTLTSIAAQEALNMPADVVVPAALQGNYKKEVQKHVRGKTPPRHIQSMQNVAVKNTPPKNKLMIVDEAHRAREPGTKTHQVLSRNSAEKRLLLTGSPFYNHPADIAPLINMAAGSRVLPSNPQDFEKRYVSMSKVSPGVMGRLRGIKSGVIPNLNKKREEELRGHFGKWVDYHPGSTEGFPQVEREDIEVPMTPEQLGVYETLMDRAPPWVAYKIKKGLPPSKAESQQLNAFMGGVRQVSNSTAPYQTDEPAHDPKIQKAFENLKDYLDKNQRAKAVVYSNYLQAGIDPYKRRLQDAHIPFGEFTGQMDKAERDELVRQYNANKLRALLISSAGGEGLDLKGTRLMQILDPHWNDEKIKQVQGRGIRYKSHDDLPPEERKVLIQRYLATRPRSGLLERVHAKKPGGSVDQYLVARAAEKERLIQQFRDLLPREPPPQDTTDVH